MNKTPHLREIEIFKELTDREFAILRETMQEHRFEAGEALFQQNDEGNELFIVEDGKISIEVELPDGKHLEISEIPAGSFLGEMSIFEDAPRSATCRAKIPSLLYSLHKKDLYHLIGTQPSLAAKMMYRMLHITSNRLKTTDNFLSDMVQWGEAARLRAVTDEFTGLYNRRFLEGALEEQFSKAKREKQKLSIAMVDLDHFGQLNKEYGEKVGDDVILAAVSVFNSVFTDTDILVRYGGDEFTFLMPARTGAEAKNLCETVCTKLSDLPVLDGLRGSIRKLTASIGIATFPSHGKTEKTIMEKADSALYQAKEEGRNRAMLISY